jgi:CDP-glycerol glycerophosphotransferase (TagB/SpsB family)
LAGSSVALLVKLHPMDALNRLEWPRLKHVRVLTQDEWGALGANLYRVLGAAARLVTDYSSAVIDYLETGRPAVVYTPATAGYSRSMTPGALERLRAAVPTVTSETDLVEFVRGRSAPNPDRAAATELNDGTPGTACAKVLRATLPSQAAGAPARRLSRRFAEAAFDPPSP